MPDDVDRVLYLDGDLIIEGDIDELYSISFRKDMLIYAVEDPASHRNTELYNKLELDIIEDSYFQSGVMLLNVKGIKNIYSSSYIIDYICKNINKFTHADQCMLNILFKNKIDILPKKYNVLVSQEVYSDMEQVISNNIIFHFTGIKPTDYHYRAFLRGRYGKFWWKYGKQNGHYIEYLCYLLKGNLYKTYLQIKEKNYMKVYIYGTGRAALQLYKNMKNFSTIKFLGFLYDEEENFDSLVNNAVDYRRVPVENGECVIIATLNGNADRIHLYEKLQKANFRTVYTLEELMDINEELLRGFFTFYLQPYSECQNIIKEIDKIKRFYLEHESDARTIEILNNHIKYRKHKKACCWEKIDDYFYFPKDIEGWNDFEGGTYLDCGAYIGDTFDDLVKMGINIDKYVGFEPDQINSKQLKEHIDSVKVSFETVVIEKAVWDVSGERDFQSGKGLSSSVSDIGEDKIEVVSIDDIIDSERVVCIKMDVEGSEYKAILGASKIIKRDRPKLAISVYHKPEDIYEIPRLIHELNPKYKFFLRVYCTNGFDTVLYAI